MTSNEKEKNVLHYYPFSSVQSLSHVRLFATPRITAHQASLSITNSRSLLKLMPIELVMPSSHLILCRPLLLLSPICPSIRVFSNESTLCMRWPKYWSFSFSISPSLGKYKKTKERFLCTVIKKAKGKYSDNLSADKKLLHCWWRFRCYRLIYTYHMTAHLFTLV